MEYALTLLASLVAESVVCEYSKAITTQSNSPCVHRSSRYGTAIDTGRDLDWNTDRYIIIGRRTNSEWIIISIRIVHVIADFILQLIVVRA